MVYIDIYMHAQYYCDIGAGLEEEGQGVVRVTTNHPSTKMCTITAVQRRRFDEQVRCKSKPRRMSHDLQVLVQKGDKKDVGWRSPGLRMYGVHRSKPLSV